MIEKESITSVETDINDMRQHLMEVQSAREAIVSAYTAIMCVDVPQMTETYEKNLDEQIERAVNFEKDIKRAIFFFFFKSSPQGGGRNPGGLLPNARFSGSVGPVKGSSLCPHPTQLRLSQTNPWVG